MHWDKCELGLRFQSRSYWCYEYKGIEPPCHLLPQIYSFPFNHIIPALPQSSYLPLGTLLYLSKLSFHLRKLGLMAPTPTGW